MSESSRAASLGLAALILYLGANALSGEDGLVSYFDLQARAHALEAEAARLAACHEALAARAQRLRAESLDLDYLEERARVVLGAARDGEIVIALPPEEPLDAGASGQ